MPIYTYKCDACDQYFEQKQRMSDEPLQDCILCNDGRVRRVINSVGVVFKGNGFYVTDTRKPNGNGTSSSNGKTETKPAAKEKENSSNDTTAASSSKETSKAAAATS